MRRVPPPPNDVPSLVLTHLAYDQRSPDLKQSPIVRKKHEYSIENFRELPRSQADPAQYLEDKEDDGVGVVAEGLQETGEEDLDVLLHGDGNLLQ